MINISYIFEFSKLKFIMENFLIIILILNKRISKFIIENFFFIKEDSFYLK